MLLCALAIWPQPVATLQQLTSQLISPSGLMIALHIIDGLLIALHHTQIIQPSRKDTHGLGLISNIEWVHILQACQQVNLYLQFTTYVAEYWKHRAYSQLHVPQAKLAWNSPGSHCV